MYHPLNKDEILEQSSAVRSETIVSFACRTWDLGIAWTWELFILQ